jgi:oligopeptide/dipeptide ABC transporter ATP-binding protein
MSDGRPPSAPDGPILEASGVVKHFGHGRRPDTVIALREVDLDVRSGTSIGIVGESGSGKTTLLRLLLNLERATRGEVRYEGRPLDRLAADEERRYRRNVQAVFQETRSSLDPRDEVWELVAEPAAVGLGIGRKQQQALAARMLDVVGLPAGYASRRPSQLSGGECQRVAIARALSSEPEVVVLDEPVTALDVSLRGMILNLLRDVAASRGATYVVVSHDITPIYFLTERLYVLYGGYVIEEGPTAEVVAAPRHPYTELLIRSVDEPLEHVGEEMLRPDREGSCPFLSRCPHARPECEGIMPGFRAPDGDGHRVRCYLWPEGTGGATAVDPAGMTGRTGDRS